MKSHPIIVAVASLLITVSLVPSLLLAMPVRAHAQEFNPVSVPVENSGLNGFIGTVKSILTQVNTFTTAAATVADHINTYVLQPLAFVMSGQLMKALTASVMKFVIGKANGTGVPQFTVDVQRSIRSISDFQTNAYLRQVSLTNSPFASSIAMALGINYNQSTSLAGFWAANQNTLGQNIPTYQPGYLSGNWSQGGTAAWFQLTTQTQNNPYILYQNTQAHLANVIGPGVGGSSGARLAQLSWGQGFMSWCGTNDVQSSASSNYQSCIAACNDAGYTSACADKCGQNFSVDGGNVPSGGVNPGDPCTRSDGTPGVVQTPGSTIKATLDKVLGGQQDKLVQMGNISSQVNSILGNIGTVLNTINLAANILGGGDSGSQGLIAAGQPNGALSTFDAPTTQSGLKTGYGTGDTQINAADAASAVTAATQQSTSTNTTISDYNYAGAGVSNSDMLGRVKNYTIAWNAIGSAASSTASTLQTMMSTCHAYFNGTSTYENAAQNALSFEVTPVLTQAAGISAITDAAIAQYNLVQSESNTSSTYAADLQKLNTMTPTATDVTAAQYSATAYGGATAKPVGSLTVTGGTTVDQMNLIRNNAAAIQTSACTANNNAGA